MTMRRPRLVAIVVPSRRRAGGKVRANGQMITLQPFAFRDTDGRALKAGKRKRN